MTTEYVLSAIKEYADEFYKSPTKYYDMKKEDFLVKAYTRWSFDELVEYILDHPEEKVFYSVEDFRHEMDNFCCYAKTDDAKLIFLIAYDTATEVLDLLISLEREE